LTQFCGVERNIVEFVDTAEPRVAPRSEYTCKLLSELGLFREFVDVTSLPLYRQADYLGLVFEGL